MRHEGQLEGPKGVAGKRKKNQTRPLRIYKIIIKCEKQSKARNTTLCAKTRKTRKTKKSNRMVFPLLCFFFSFLSLFHLFAKNDRQQKRERPRTTIIVLLFEFFMFLVSLFDLSRSTTCTDKKIPNVSSN